MMHVLIPCLTILSSHILYSFVWINPTKFKNYSKQVKCKPVDLLAYTAISLKLLQLAILVSLLQNLVIVLGSPILALLKLVLLITGQTLNMAVYNKLGNIGVYYGNRLGYRTKWINTFPFNVVDNPQYVGTSMTLTSVIWLYPYHDVVIICSFWIFLYFVTSKIEKL